MFYCDSYTWLVLFDVFLSNCLRGVYVVGFAIIGWDACWVNCLNLVCLLLCFIWFVSDCVALMFKLLISCGLFIGLGVLYLLFLIC